MFQLQEAIIRPTTELGPDTLMIVHSVGFHIVYIFSYIIHHM